MVEGFCVGDFVLIVFQELGAEGAVKTLDIGIGLRVSWVGIEVHDGAVADGFDEVFFELAAIVGLDMADGEGGDASEFIQKVSGVLTIEFVIAVGEGKTAVQVDGREHIAFEAVAKDGQRVHLQQISRFFRLVAIASLFLSPELLAFADQEPVVEGHSKLQASTRQPPGRFQGGDHPAD